MKEDNFVEVNVDDTSFVEIESLVDDTAQLAAEAVCPCGCGMCICCTDVED